MKKYSDEELVRMTNSFLYSAGLEHCMGKVVFDFNKMATIPREEGIRRLRRALEVD